MTTEPTCTKEGEKTFTCTCCDETRTEAVPALGHTYGDKWESSDKGHWQVCTVCGEASDLADHDFQWVTDQEATATEDGSKHQECTVCGFKGASEVIPAAGTTDAGDNANGENGATSNSNATGTSPKTGDESNVVLPAVVLTLSMGALAGIALLGKRRRG